MPYCSPIHKHPSYSRWAFTLCVIRSTLQELSKNGIPARGGNFVDIGLRAIVKLAGGTLLAHDAEKPTGQLLNQQLPLTAS